MPPTSIVTGSFLALRSGDKGIPAAMSLIHSSGRRVAADHQVGRLAAAYHRAAPATCASPWAQALTHVLACYPQMESLETIGRKDVVRDNVRNPPAFYLGIVRRTAERMADGAPRPLPQAAPAEAVPPPGAS